MEGEVGRVGVSRVRLGWDVGYGRDCGREGGSRVRCLGCSAFPQCVP